jgi:hypothetical protein
MQPRHYQANLITQAIGGLAAKGDHFIINLPHNMGKTARLAELDFHNEHLVDPFLDVRTRLTDRTVNGTPIIHPAAIVDELEFLRCRFTDRKFLTQAGR